MEFGFVKTLKSEAVIDIEDIGKCAIEAIDEETNHYFLAIVTQLGQVSCFSWGPVIPDDSRMMRQFNYSKWTFSYNEKRLMAEITRWLNDSTKKITDAWEIEFDDNLFTSIPDVMRETEKLIKGDYY